MKRRIETLLGMLARHTEMKRKFHLSKKTFSIPHVLHAYAIPLPHLFHTFSISILHICHSYSMHIPRSFHTYSVRIRMEYVWHMYGKSIE